MIQWRRVAWSPSVISSHWSVPLWIAHSRGRSRDSLRSGLGPVGITELPYGPIYVPEDSQENMPAPE